MGSKAQIEYILTEMPPAERSPFINKLKPSKFKTSLNTRKAGLERIGEYKDFARYQTEGAGLSDKRQLQKKITESTKKVFIDANKPELLEAFETYQKQETTRRNNIKLLFSRLSGVRSVDYGHEVPLGRGDSKLLKQSLDVALKILRGNLTPTTPLSDSGSDADAIIQSKRDNIRLSDNPIVNKRLLQHLNRPTSQREAAINFLENRPDLNTSKLSINHYLTDSIKMNQLMTGEINVDQLEMQNLLEAELKAAGVFKGKPNKQQYQVLKQLINRAHTLDLVKSAQDTTPGKGEFDITTKERKKESRDFSQRKRTFRRENPNTKTTILPSEATGQTVVNRVPPTITKAIALSKQVQAIENEFQSDRRVNKNRKVRPTSTLDDNFNHTGDIYNDLGGFMDTGYGQSGYDKGNEGIITDPLSTHSVNWGKV